MSPNTRNAKAKTAASSFTNTSSRTLRAADLSPEVSSKMQPSTRRGKMMSMQRNNNSRLKRRTSWENHPGNTSQISSEDESHQSMASVSDADEEEEEQEDENEDQSSRRAGSINKQNTQPAPRRPGRPPGTRSRTSTSPKKRSFSQAHSRESTPAAHPYGTRESSRVRAHKRINSGIVASEDLLSQSSDSEGSNSDGEPVRNDEDIFAGILDDDDYDEVNLISDSDENETVIAEQEERAILGEGQDPSPSNASLGRELSAVAEVRSSPAFPEWSGLPEDEQVAPQQVPDRTPRVPSAPPSTPRPAVQHPAHARHATLNAALFPPGSSLGTNAHSFPFVPVSSLHPELSALIEGNEDEDLPDDEDSHCTSTTGTDSTTSGHGRRASVRFKLSPNDSDSLSLSDDDDTDGGDTTDEDEPVLATPIRPLKQNQHVSHENSPASALLVRSAVLQGRKPRRGPIRGTWTDHGDKPIVTMSQGGRNFLYFPVNSIQRRRTFPSAQFSRFTAHPSRLSVSAAIHAASSMAGTLLPAHSNGAFSFEGLDANFTPEEIQNIVHAPRNRDLEDMFGSSIAPTPSLSRVMRAGSSSDDEDDTLDINDLIDFTGADDFFSSSDRDENLDFYDTSAIVPMPSLDTEMTSDLRPLTPLKSPSSEQSVNDFFDHITSPGVATSFRQNQERRQRFPS